MKATDSLFRLVRSLAPVAALLTSAFAYQGMPVPKLHVSGRYIQDASGKNVLLHGVMQDGAAWFNGQNANFTDPTDFTSTSNVAPALNYFNNVANIFATTSAQYGQSHGWTASFVRFIGDESGISNFAPGWDVNGNLANSAQFNGWIQNVLVPYVSHCQSVGLYVVLCGNPSTTYPGGDTSKNMTQQYQTNLIKFWQTVANAPGIKGANNVLFEICNEPIDIESSFGANDWGFGSSPYWAAISRFMQPVVNAIRNTGADNIILIPGLGWEGDYAGFPANPVTGTNIGYAAHLYPGYGNVHDNVSAINNLWTSTYKPTADQWPMVITEMFWDPNDGTGYQNLWNATTSGFGNTVKSCIDNEGNVSYLIGMVADMLANLNSGLSNTTLSTSQGAQAAFSWWTTYQWAAPTNGTTIANGTYKIVSRNSGLALEVLNGGTTNGSQVDQNTYSGSSNQKWTVTNLGNGVYKIIGVGSGRSVDIASASTANGAKVQIWDYYGNTNQQFTITATSGGYYRITPQNATSSCLDVSGASTSPGAFVQLWTWYGANNQQWTFQAP